MDWREHISKAYDADNARNDWDTLPVFRDPASQTAVQDAEKCIGTSFPKELRELLSQTDGSGEKMMLKDGPSDVDLGSFMLRASEIADYTDWFRRSGLTSNISFQEMIFIGDTHVDGIYFALRSGESTVYAWYPMNREFRVVASNLEEFIFGWLSGMLSI